MSSEWLVSSMCMFVSFLLYHSMVWDRDTRFSDYKESVKEVKGKHLGWKNDMGEVGKRHKNRKRLYHMVLVAKQTILLPLW